MCISGQAVAALLAVLLERPEEPVTLLRFAFGFTSGNSGVLSQGWPQSATLSHNPSGK